MKTLILILTTLFIFTGCEKRNDIGLFESDDRSTFMNGIITADRGIVFIATSRSNHTKERSEEHFKKHLKLMKTVQETTNEVKANVQSVYNICHDIIDSLLGAPEVEGVNIFFYDPAQDITERYSTEDCMLVQTNDLLYSLIEDSRTMNGYLSRIM